jgi:hypothetical protein
MSLAGYSQQRINAHYETEGARVVVNFPAFRLYLYQGDVLIKSYPVGVGMNDFKPIFGEMLAKEIVYNPSWSPTGSAWSRGHKATGPNAPGNPLGKVKLPLYGLYLIHGGAHPSHLGHAVSHGCVRMLNKDAVDLMRRIAEIQNGEEGLRVAKRDERTHGRSVPLKLDKPAVVDFRYDTVAVEGDKILVYPDVYKFGGDRQKSLEDALANAGIKWDSLPRKKRDELSDIASSEKRKVQAIDLGEQSVVKGRPVIRN